MSEIRVSAGWWPAWDSSVRGWAVNFIRKDGWRCDQVSDAEDLLQDAYLTFVRVAAAYPRVIEARHFMALFKTAMRNEMWDRARVKHKKRDIIHDGMYDQEFFIGEDSNGGYLNALINTLPPELKLVLWALTDRKMLKGMAIRQSGPRENMNMKLHRVLGIVGTADLVGQLKEALGG